jgi:hypothetical protein
LHKIPVNNKRKLENKLVQREENETLKELKNVSLCRVFKKLLLKIFKEVAKIYHKKNIRIRKY